MSDDGRNIEISENVNTSARNINADSSSSQKSAPSSTQRPNSAPSGANAVSGSYSDNCRNSKYQNPSLPRLFSTEKHPSGHASGIQSSGSLTRTPSIETPLGVVRLSSSSSFEPVRMHSGSSTESFRRDISLYKLNAMPVLEEDDNLSEDAVNEIGGRSKTRNRAKVKKSRRQRHDPEMVEIHLENEENEEEQERREGISEQKKGTFTTLSMCFKGLFPCTKPNKNDLDPDCLLDVTSSPHET